MPVLTESWILDFLSLFSTLIVVLVSLIKFSHSYWQRRGLKTPPVTFPFGNSKKLFTQEESQADFFINTYKWGKSRNVPHVGLYIIHTPLYVPIDLEIVKRILQTDFHHFENRGMYYDEENDPLSAHLFSLEGKKWRNLRVKLTPTFTSGKMKMMFETLVKCGNELKTEMDKNAAHKTIDIKEILVRFTTDIIGNCAFGIDCNAIKNPDNEFSKYFKLFSVNSFRENVEGFITFVVPSLAKLLKLKVVKPDLSNFFLKIVKDTIAYREANNIHRKDFMHLLIQIKNRGSVDGESILKDNNSEKVNLTENEIAAQAFLFFLGGYETSSTTMTFCLFELASNPDIQEKLRREVEEILEKHKGQLTYEAIAEMHYMEQVINETLRKYPPFSALFRISTSDYKVPGTNVVLEKGTVVWIPVIGIQHDSDYYPNPEKFDPDRFLEENKRNRPACSFLPFGEGPRACIGLRFGMMQTKVGLSVLLKNYKFSVNSKTSVPLKMDPQNFVLCSEGGIWLDYTKL